MKYYVSSLCLIISSLQKCKKGICILKDAGVLDFQVVWEKQWLDLNWEDVLCLTELLTPTSYSINKTRGLHSNVFTWVWSIYGGEKGWICGGSIIDFNHITGQSLEYHKLTKEHCKETRNRRHRYIKTWWLIICKRSAHSLGFLFFLISNFLMLFSLECCLLLAGPYNRSNFSTVRHISTQPISH